MFCFEEHFCFCIHETLCNHCSFLPLVSDKNLSAQSSPSAGRRWSHRKIKHTHTYIHTHTHMHLIVTVTRFIHHIFVFIWEFTGGPNIQAIYISVWIRRPRLLTVVSYFIVSSSFGSDPLCHSGWITSFIQSVLKHFTGKCHASD